MIRGFLSIFLLTIGAVSGAVPQEGQLDASRALFAVMAAVNAAGYDVGVDSPLDSPVRQMVRREVAAKNPPSLAEIKRFYRTHRKPDPGEDLGQYVSFALCLGNPPDFAFRYPPAEMPPDVDALAELRPLLVRFSKEADLDRLWEKAQPAIDEAIARYHEPAAAALARVNAYLRSSNSGAMGTRFQIYLDLLGAPNQINTRSYKSDYFIVLTPSAEPQVDDIRHAFLHYQIDPLSIRYRVELDQKKSLIDYAMGAPALEEAYKADFGLLATECLIKAVESRLSPVGERQGMVAQALREGYILTPAFAELLPVYERQEQSMRFFYTDMVAAIDLKKETRRLDNVQFASEKAVRKSKPAPVVKAPEPTGAEKTAAEAEELYRARDLEPAKAKYASVLRETQDAGLHGKAYYGMARIAVLQNDPETAEKLFEKAAEAASDPEVKSWAYVYLGRLADASGQREQATGRYRAALDVSGGSEKAREAARKGLEKAFTK